jgi:hypothetical protein
MVLRPPVEPMLAQARDTVPAPGVLPGELRFQPKFDGYRAIVFTPWSAPGILAIGRISCRKSTAAGRARARRRSSTPCP